MSNGGGNDMGHNLAGVVKLLREAPAKVEVVASSVGVPAMAWLVVLAEQIDVIAASIITLAGGVYMYYKIRAARAEAIIKEAEADRARGKE